MWRIVETGDFRVDADTFRVSVRNRHIRLTPKEFKLMLYLAKHPGCIVTHQKLVSVIWGATTGGERECLRVLIGQLRRKIETPGTPRYIVTEPWVGYRLEPTGTFLSPEFDPDQLPENPSANFGPNHSAMST
jgi:two-component system KDP operon response regulator KdpE